MQAYTGMMSINRDTAGSPQRIEMLAIDFSTGLYAFQAVASALYRKAVKGRGTHIQTSLLECALALQEGAMMEHHLQGGAAEPQREARIAKRLSRAAKRAEDVAERLEGT